MNLQKIHFDTIVAGSKIYECRLYDDKRKKISLFDLIEFRCENKRHKVIVIELSFFKSFEHALIEKGVNNVLPNVETINDGIQLYHDIECYREGENRHGVLCIKFLKYD